MNTDQLRKEGAVADFVIIVIAAIAVVVMMVWNV